MNNLRVQTYRPFTMEPLGGKESAHRILNLGVEVLTSLDLEYWLSAGTLLGIHRDQKFIDHDTDIDVEILGPINGNILIDKMVESGFELIRSMTITDRPYQLAFIHPDGNIIFDVYFYYKVGNRLINYNDQGTLWYPEDMLLDFQDVSFGNRTFRVPEPDWYCEFRYGSSWKTPKTVKGSWQTDASNLI